MSTKQGNLKDYQGNKIIPNTSSAAVLDVAKNQALSATLVNTPDKATLGYGAFSTVLSYSVGDRVYYENKLYEFTSAHSAGAWNSAHVTEVSIKDFLEDIEDNYLRKGSYDASTAVGMADQLRGNVYADDLPNWSAVAVD